MAIKWLVKGVLMVFGLNLFEMAKKEILKVDVTGKPGVPDALEALDAGEAAIDQVVKLLSRFSAEDIRAIVAWGVAHAPDTVRAKFSKEEVVDLAEALAALPAALTATKNALEGFEIELKKK